MILYTFRRKVVDNLLCLCNDKPVLPGPPSIVTMGLEDFREGKIMNFVDPFKGQHGYEVTEDGRVRNEDGSYTRYMHETGWLAPIRREYLNGDAVLWTGEGYDPYRAASMMPFSYFLLIPDFFFRFDHPIRSDPPIRSRILLPSAAAKRTGCSSCSLRKCNRISYR